MEKRKEHFCSFLVGREVVVMESPVLSFLETCSLDCRHEYVRWWRCNCLTQEVFFKRRPIRLCLPWLKMYLLSFFRPSSVCWYLPGIHFHPLTESYKLEHPIDFVMSILFSCDTSGWRSDDVGWRSNSRGLCQLSAAGIQYCTEDRKSPRDSAVLCGGCFKDMTVFRCGTLYGKTKRRQPNWEKIGVFGRKNGSLEEKEMGRQKNFWSSGRNQEKGETGEIMGYLNSIKPGEKQFRDKTCNKWEHKSAHLGENQFNWDK